MLLTCCSDADLNYENADPDPTSVFKVLSKPQWLCLYWWLPVQELLLLNIITWLICPHVQFLIQGVVGYLIPTTASQTTAMLFSHASVYGRRGMFKHLRTPSVCKPPVRISEGEVLQRQIPLQHRLGHSQDHDEERYTARYLDTNFLCDNI